MELHFDVEKGSIVRAQIFSDTLDPAPFDRLAQLLVSCPYRSDAIASCLQGWQGEFPASREALSEFADWLLAALR